MIELARLYATLSYFHPTWDEALAEGFVTALENPTARVIGEALAALKDPATRLVIDEMPAEGGSFYAAHSAEGAPLLVLSNVALLRTTEAQERLARFWREASRAMGVICDLRATTPSASADAERFATLTDGIARPTLWQRAHYGKIPEGESSTGGFRTGWLVRNAALLSPGWPPTVFLVTRETPIPPFAVALQQLGLAVIFLEGEGALETRWTTPAVTLSLRHLGLAQVRIGATRVVINQRFASELEALEAAQSWLRNPVATPIPPPPLPAPRPFSVPVSRLHGALRLWSAIWLLHPDRERLRPLWEQAWPVFYGRVHAAQTPLAFHKAVRQLLVVTGDGHAVARSSLEGLLLGEIPAPVRLREIEHKLTVVRLSHPAAAAGGLLLGDVIESVEALTTAQRVAQLSPWLAVSTPQARSNYTANRLLLGPLGSVVALTVRGKDGKPRRAFCPRLVATALTERDGPPLRALPRGVLYADLDQIRREEIASLFARARTARALVLDLRGYADELAWELTPYLSRNDSTIAARYERPIAVPPEGPELANRSLTEHFVQLVPRREGRARFLGKVVCLIDERTQSQAELTALFLVACGAILIGSPTAGAVGDVTSVQLTDGILVRFSGQEVRFPDGRKIARVGIQPQVRVVPTLAGIRAGRDEVLEAAQRWLK